MTRERDANVVSISSSGQYIALGGTSNKTYVFDRRNMGTVLHSLEHNGLFQNFYYPFSSLQLIAVFFFKNIFLDPNDGLPHDGIMSLQWIPNSSILLSGGNDSTVRVWNIEKSRHPLIYKFENHDSPVTSIRISPGRFHHY